MPLNVQQDSSPIAFYRVVRSCLARVGNLNLILKRCFVDFHQCYGTFLVLATNSEIPNCINDRIRVLYLQEFIVLANDLK